ncbi:DMT family transporter [Desulfovibrio sp. UCD-KL4C]|uniref:DMT family transporter n=1 Tax=Desulfovibrio sp. UCD-KL4C TaxID=2578120 RepID=UPI0025BDB4F9|nr:DMT family transporter [Desulfovibrio sp. UCD-KL4C]
MNWNEFKKTQNAGYLFIVLGIINWSGNFVAARGLAGIIDPATLNLLRWLMATLIFLPFGIRSFWKERVQVAKLWKELSAIAICGISLYDTLIFIAGRTSEALNMSLISTLSPLLTALVAQFFMREKLKPSMFMGIAVSTFGVALLVTDGSINRLLNMHFALGDMLILCTAMMSAIYNTVVKTVSGKISQTTLLMSCCLFGTLYILPLYLWETGGTIVIPPMTHNLVLSLIYLSVFASLLCYLFWNMAVEVLGASKTALFYYTLPPASAAVAWFVIHEPVNWNQILSGTVILVGILFALYGFPSKFMKQKAHSYG